jgi:hypothetical protein
MNAQSSRQGTEQNSTSQTQSRLEYEALKRREETLQWLSVNAEHRLRRAWRGRKHH